MADQTTQFTTKSDTSRVRPEPEVLARKTPPEQIALIFALLALTISIALAIFGEISATKSTGVLEEANSASVITEQLLRTLLDAETGQRGFLLTSSPEFLRPYERAVDQLQPVLEEFHAATSGLSVDIDDCAKIEALTAKKMAELNQTITLAKETNRSFVLPVVTSGRGNDLMEQLRTASARVESAYRGYVAQEQRKVNERQIAVLLTTGIGSGLAAIILIWAVGRLKFAYSRQASLLKQIVDSEQQYKKLADRLQSIREDERAHLSREIHDVLGQAFTGVKLDMAAASQRIERGQSSAALQKLSAGIEAVEESIRLLRKMAGELRPPLLDHMGLSAAIRAYAQEFSIRTGITCHVDGETETMPLSSEEGIAIYRIFQESLTNIARHAGTKEAWVKIFSSDRRIKLQIVDHGLGFDTGKNKTSLGLLGMGERARSIGAELTIRSELDMGTTVDLALSRKEA
jgi:signal transduction histidine kinase